MSPADYLETVESWRIALANKEGPSVLALTRQSVSQIVSRNISQNLCSKGGYILSGNNQETVDVAIFATGSELSIALEVKDILSKNGFSTNVISMLCFELFFKQQPSYIQNILSNAKLKVAIEAASSFGWHRIIGEKGMFFGMEQFGLSAPSNDLYSYFGLTSSNISEKIMARIQKN